MLMLELIQGSTDASIPDMCHTAEVSVHFAFSAVLIMFEPGLSTGCLGKGKLVKQCEVNFVCQAERDLGLTSKL